MNLAKKGQIRFSLFTVDSQNPKFSLEYHYCNVSLTICCIVQSYELIYLTKYLLLAYDHYYVRDRAQTFYR